MIANYQSSTPFLNNHGQALLWKKHHDDERDVIKAKSIGEDIDAEISLKDVSVSKHNNKEFFTKPVYQTFSGWSFSDFEKQYQDQIALADTAISFLDKIGSPLQQSAKNQTENQYRDFFFHNSFAYLVSDLYTYFNSTNEQQAKNKELFQKVINRPEVKTRLAQIKKNKKILSEEEDPEDMHKVKGQTGPINFSFQQNDDTVVVNFDELIKISGYTFRPIIQGKETYVKWQEDVIYNNTDRFLVILGSRQGGKSQVMGLRALLSTFKGYRRDTLVCAFRTDTTDHIRKYIGRLMENFPEGTFVEAKKKSWITNTLTGSRIIFRSLSEEASRVRGWTLHEIIMDECYLVDDDVFESVLMPTLSTTGGSICMLSTPGTKNWFFWEVMKARQKEEDYAYYQFTIDENPFIVPSERARILKKKDDPIIRREYYCEFDDGGNSVFRPKKTDDYSFYNEHHEKAWYILAYDPARKGKDRAGYTCLMVAGGKVFVIRSGFIPDGYKKDWDLQYEWFEKNILNDGEDWHLVMDCTGTGDGVVKLFQKKRKVQMAIHYVTGNTEYEDPENPYGSALAMKVGKSRLINNAQNYMDEGVATFFKYTNTDLFYEMDAIVERRTSIGMISFLTKGFDDITNSCMIGLYYVEHQRLLTKKVPETKQKAWNLGDEPYFQKSNEPHVRRYHGSHF